MTLIESLVSVALLSLLLISILGAFYISRLSTERAKHRIAAMNTIRQYMETEIKNGYLGGAAGGDYYVTVDSAGPVTVVIDDRNTPSDTSDDLMGRLWPKPYPAGALMEGASRYKLIGFVVDWKEKAEDFDISGSVSPPWEMAAAYVAEHR